jgi:hypothetical protein
MLQQRPLKLGLIKLLKLMFHTLFTIHIFACLFLGLATWQKRYGLDSWINSYRDGILENSTIIK